MPLQNFGSILNFAEEIESLDRQFYAAAGGNPACAGHKALFAQLEAEAARNVTTVQRIRRENVTEMILEPVKDFVRAPFCEACEGAAVMAPDQVLAAARRAGIPGRTLLRRSVRETEGADGSVAGAEAARQGAHGAAGEAQRAVTIGAPAGPAATGRSGGLPCGG